MSITRALAMACPACGVELHATVVDSLNAGRHPHLRAELLARRLHLFGCGACGEPVAVDKSLVYVDFERGQLFLAAPLAARGSGTEAAWEEAAVRLFTRWLRDDAPAVMRQRAGTFAVRLCFGLEELREKVVIDEAGLDDGVIEVLKAALLMAEPRFEAEGVAALSLDGVDERGGLRFVAPPSGLVARVEPGVYARVEAHGDVLPPELRLDGGPWRSLVGRAAIAADAGEERTGG